MPSPSEDGAPPPRRLEPERLGDHLDRLYRAAWALCGSREDAEDLVQETYARVLARPRFLRRGDDLGYLMRVLHNVFVSGVRSRQARPATVELEEASAPDPDDARTQRHVESREVLAAVAALAPDHRDVLAAVDIAGLSYREAGRILGVPEGTIMSRLFRARAKVVAALDSPSPIRME